MEAAGANGVQTQDDYTHPSDILGKASIHESSRSPVHGMTLIRGLVGTSFNQETVCYAVREKLEQRIQRGHLRPQRANRRVTERPAYLRKAEQVLLVLFAGYGKLVYNKLDDVEDEEGAGSSHASGGRLVLGMEMVRDQRTPSPHACQKWSVRICRPSVDDLHDFLFGAPSSSSPLAITLIALGQLDNCLIRIASPHTTRRVEPKRHASSGINVLGFLSRILERDKGDRILLQYLTYRRTPTVVF